jgi:thymidine phosphorylase
VSQSQGNAAAAPVRAVDVIRKKRDGRELSRAEIEYLVRAYTTGEIPDYQVSAWLMAVILRGLTRAETSVLTDAMLRSGDVLDLSEFPAKKVDKHSTGGVGDKTSLVLALWTSWNRFQASMSTSQFHSSAKSWMRVAAP